MSYPVQFVVRHQFCRLLLAASAAWLDQGGSPEWAPVAERSPARITRTRQSAVNFPQYRSAPYEHLAAEGYVYSDARCHCPPPVNGAWRGVLQSQAGWSLLREAQEALFLCVRLLSNPGDPAWIEDAVTAAPRQQCMPGICALSRCGSMLMGCS